MKKTALTFDVNQYDALRSLIIAEHRILNMRKTLLSGTNQIPANLVVCSFLYDRNLMLYDTLRTYEKYGAKKSFTFLLFEVAALSYFLSSIDDLPAQLVELQKEVREAIKPFEFEAVKTAFQTYYEEKLMDTEGYSFTELRDEVPYMYDYYFDKYNNSQI